MAKLWFFLLTLAPLLPLLCTSFSPDHPTDQRLLVLIDDLAIKSSHSLFFKSLRSRGFDLDFKLADDPKLALQRYGQYLYDGLVLFSPSIERFFLNPRVQYQEDFLYSDSIRSGVTKVIERLAPDVTFAIEATRGLGGSLDLAAVLDFVDSGHDLIVAADVGASDLIRDIAAECGVDFDEDSSAVVIDHTAYAVSEIDGDHTLIAGDDFIRSDVILGEKVIEAPVLFRGIGHSLNVANSLVLKVLSASPSAYSANPTSKLSSPPSLTGSTISLVSVVQARNNARILISGSLQLFSNKFFRSGVQKAGCSTKHDKSGNEQFVTELSKWVFHERGHLKAVNVNHHKIGEAVEPAMYRISDDLEYSVEIYEWSGKSWKPYVADDVQVQFYMMSPYILKTLSNDQQGMYSTSFRVPDVYGVFQFKVEYQRLGYTCLTLSKQIPVRPFRHNEYERFITAAYPYYGASFSMMAGFFIFSFAYLYNK